MGWPGLPLGSDPVPDHFVQIRNADPEMGVQVILHHMFIPHVVRNEMFRMNTLY